MSIENEAPVTAPRSKDEVALELMKFISLQTGFGKGAAPAGFSGKVARTPEEQVDALLELFERCRFAIHSEPRDTKSP